MTEPNLLELASSWAASGMAWLTGRPDGPARGGPSSLIGAVGRWSEELTARSSSLGTPLVVAPLALLAERAAVTGLARGGRVSCGGGTHLLPCADGWVAASLTRASDWELVAAWLGRPGPVAEGGWAEVADGVAALGARQVRAQAMLVGLPVSVLGERLGGSGWAPGADPPGTGSTDATDHIHGIHARRIRPAPAVRSLADLVVVDLSSLWAGPLVSRLLGRAGARVVKVESTARPDGARFGSAAFYARLNSGKQSVALDFATPSGRRRLAAVVAAADVVITGSRPRALEQLGLDVESLVQGGRPRVWLSITGYGAAGASGRRVAFGDDAAVAGGLVAGEGSGDGPYFCGDAIADPLTGMASTVAVLGALMSDGSWVIDASMADVAGGLAGPALSMEGLAVPPPPDTDPVAGEVPTGEPRELGADTEAVLAELTPG